MTVPFDASKSSLFGRRNEGFGIMQFSKRNRGREGFAEDVFVASAQKLTPFIVRL
jgi:hypothetical protein